MKETRFEALSLAQEFVTRELKSICEETSTRAFDSLYERCICCTEADGDCIE
jgi:hypothetical protein